MRIAFLSIAVLAFFATMSTCGFAQETVGEKIGKAIDRGVNELRQGWTEVRQSVEKMGIEARVYGRLHWDKALHDASLTIEARERGEVVLKGSVPDSVARQKAVQLTQDTVGVSQVTDQLAIAPKKD